ncbi:c-type cytochrome [Photobacterium alginatilyticum]|uniref:Cytochrome c5 family protein n=1 Tax=Photobacterium alginatilyticum TaxID=1775171 RepID=A0ABW9YR17_9GAMM|nr:cytochrome c5 family protein [Photobacterium alginatilyticum]NBI55931.1 cytochrome c5 family protein [Photobacterium alginatilyticum]
MELSLRQLMVAAVAAITFAGSAVAADMSDEAIAERIQPVGSVYLEGDAPAGPAVAAGPRSGDTVYGTFCVACHGAGVMGAPKKGDAADWEARLAKGNDVLADHAINGFNAMPAKGSCMDCSDDEIIAAIDHMIEGL